MLIQGKNRPGFKGNPHRLPRRAYTLASIEIDWLKTCGIKGVILDLDTTTIAGAAILKEKVSIYQWLGVGLMLSGIWALALAESAYIYK